MHYLTLDTNTWIYLANGTEPARLLTFLQEEIDKGNITILLPEQIITEWDDNKDKAVRQGIIKHFKDITKDLNRLVKLLGHRADGGALDFLLGAKADKDYFSEFVASYEKKLEEIEQAVTDNIKLIETLFSHDATIKIAIENSDYVTAGDYALAKKAPFKGKNSFGDGLIFFSLIRYLKKNDIKGALFVSYNTDDFCQSKQNPVLHEDLRPHFEAVGAQFYTIVSKALNTIKDVVSQEEIALIQEMQDEERLLSLVDICQVCEGNRHGYGNDVYFREAALEDERMRFVSNPNQVEFDFAKALPIAPALKRYDAIRVGACEWCNAVHVQCPECDSVTAIVDGELGEPKECEGGCGLAFIVDRSVDEHGMPDGDTYRLIDLISTCNKCGREFENMGDGQELCADCEEEYNSK
jgi:hypothetical protein